MLVTYIIVRVYRRDYIIVAVLAAMLSFDLSVFNAYKFKSFQEFTPSPGQKYTLRGVIEGMPKISQATQSFILRVDSLDNKPCDNLRVKVKLNNKFKYPQKQTRFNLETADKVELTTKLKKACNLGNPGFKDAEKHAFLNRISAFAYVKGNIKILTTKGKSLRQRLVDSLESSLHGRQDSITNLIYALALGLTDKLSFADWQVLRNTGTTHLMAISGLHIGLLAALVLWLARKALLILLPTDSGLPVKIYAGGIAVVVATFYAYITGFAIPTQRAVLLLLVWFIALYLRWQLTKSDILALVLSLVLFLSPLAVLEYGFWLSFTAVAVLLYSSITTNKEPINKTRPIKKTKPTKKISTNNKEGRKKQLQQWAHGLVRAQWVCFLGLLPLSLSLFGMNSIVGIIANMLAGSGSKYVGSTKYFVRFMYAYFKLFLYWFCLSSIILFMAVIKFYAASYFFAYKCGVFISLVRLSQHRQHYFVSS